MEADFMEISGKIRMNVSLTDFPRDEQVRLFIALGRQLGAWDGMDPKAMAQLNLKLNGSK